MIPHAKIQFLVTLFVIAVCAPSPVNGLNGGLVTEKVLRVIDGDTMEISGGKRVRLLGIDAPELDEPFSDLAVSRLRTLTASGPVTLETCQDRDIYGRLLSVVRVEGTNVNGILLEEGMALPMLIPPCGRSVAGNILKAAARGAMSGQGIYSLERYEMFTHLEAGEHIGEHAMVKGRIHELFKGKRAWHLNFGTDWKTDFTAVLFREGQQRFIDLGIDAGDLVGLEVLVIGKIKRYNGPEIIIRGPDQVIPLSGITIKDSTFKIQNKGLEK